MSSNFFYYTLGECSLLYPVESLYNFYFRLENVSDTLIAWYTFAYLKNSETVCYDGIYASVDGWFCIVEASDYRLYQRKQKFLQFFLLYHIFPIK